MRLVILAAFAALACVSLSAEDADAQSAPFCLVSASGSDCWYYSLSECQRIAASRDGGCVANQNASNQGQQATPPSVWRSFNEGVEAGRQRRERENQRETVQTYRSEPDGRWMDFCERMQATDFQLLEAMQERMSTEEYAQATRAVVNRATYCRSIAQ